MIIKALATGVAAVAAIGAAAAGLTSETAALATPRVQSVVFSVPQDPAASLPSTGQLSGLLTSLANPNVPFASKSGLVEGGISPTEASLADHALQKAAKKGELPLSFNITNIQPAAAGAATADVAVSGPKLAAPVMQSVTFVNQGSWMLSRDSAMALLHTASGH